MTEIERHLRDLGTSARKVGWDRPLDRRVWRKIRRRRVALPAGVVCAALALGASGTLVAEGQRPPHRRAPVVAPAASAESAPAPRLRVREVAEDGFSAVWPEDTPAQATTGCTQATTGSFRSDPVEMASAFGREVLGWHDATATVTGSTRTSRQVELRQDADPSSRINVSVVELVDHCWAVQSAFDAPGDPHTNVVFDAAAGPDGFVVQVWFDAPPGTSGEVEVGYGDHVRRRAWSGPVTSEDPVRIEMAERPDTTGHLFVFFEDDTGSVTKALAYSLPPRHFSREARERAAGP